MAVAASSEPTRAGASRWRQRYEVVAFLTPVVLFGLLALQRAIAFMDTYNPVILANGASLVLIMYAFALRRTPKDVDRSFWPWLVAMGGDFVPFAVDLSGENRWAGPAPFLIQCCGLALSFWAVWNIREAIGIVPANRGIKVGGPYRFIRHPMYTAVVVSHIGLLMVFPNPINFVMLIVVTGFKAKMVLNEERLLMKDPEYQEYAGRVRWRAIPGVV